MKKFIRVSVVMIIMLMCMIVGVSAAEERVTISGKLVSSSGDPIVMEKDGCYFELEPFRSMSYTIDENGIFTINAPVVSGEYRLQFWSNSDVGNVIKGGTEFYYAKDSQTSVTTYAEATPIVLTDGDLTGLELVVDTGYVLTGTVSLDDDIYFEGSAGYSDDRVASIDLRLKGEEYTCEARFNMIRGEDPWEYTMVVPKEAANYELKVNYMYICNGVESNLDTASFSVGSVEVTGGDALPRLPDVTLKAVRCIVEAEVDVPLLESANGSLYVDTGEKQYSASIQSYSGQDLSLEIRIPKTETAETYKLYYKFPYGDGAYVSKKNVYVAQDGSLTLDENQAGEFPLQDASHSFSLMLAPPYATGRIYIPDYTDELFYITVRGIKINSSTYNSYTISVGPGVVEIDENGDAYVPYSLACSAAEEGKTYTLDFTVSYDKGDIEELVGDMLWDTNTYYADEDGGVVVEYKDRYTFTVPESECTDLDVMIRTWGMGYENMVLQGVHGLTEVTADLPSYVFDTYQGAESLKVTFSGSTDVPLMLNGTKYTAAKLAGKTIEVSGDTLTIEYVKYSSYYKNIFYGFGITSIEPVYADDAAMPEGVIAVYTADGSTKETVLASLSGGETLRVSLADSDLSEGVLVAALYNSDGKMVDLAIGAVVFEHGTATAALPFDGCQNADDLRLMLLTDVSYSPLMNLWSFP